ncbi:FeoB-associated Cys-rich membrane protein [Pedobacter sp. MC2016-15]|uniref:FeoB-associated Cys-rich membrane protein n=1 Tax=Pedobacter sp. MC2016-15 TaxID=2994473 RepID=UPI0022460106|nr:FeoB-associated Cys-rich membrane protein [Pedobacter sp. MC2016-15]MCX2481719.1 FeoB-associated Cys-rich membrane protein [Pedobacter sp. MC2016-15]
MDVQIILVGLLFLAALFYIGRIIYRSVVPKKGGCASGCGKCGVDFSNVEIKKK